MTQTLHLLVVDRDRRAALGRALGTGALLPILVCDERVRGSLAVARWLSTMGIEGRVIGQWLGRAAALSDTIDWLVVVLSSPVSRDFSGLCWRPLRQLRETLSLCEYQEWAIDNCVNSAGSVGVDGPFGCIDSFDHVTAWVEATTGSAVREIVTYKATSYEVVIRFTTRHGDVFFKGLSCARENEAHLTSALATICSERFAETVALDVRPAGTAWWLTRACKGVSLSTASTPENVGRVAAAYAEVRQRVAAFGLRRISQWCPVLDVEEAICCINDLIGAKDITQRCRVRLQSASEAVRDPSIDISWIPLDLAPGNVLLDGDVVRFIDLDESFIGPAPLGLAMLTRRLDANRSCGPCDIIALVLEAWLGWRRVRAMTARGELVGVLDIARRRLAKRLVEELRSIN
jgi:hypothetical protein